MALQVNIPLQGGITHNNGYVRVTNARLCRKDNADNWFLICLLYTSPSPRDRQKSRMPSSA